MESLWTLINRAKNNWHIYFGEKSLKLLRIFLNGAIQYCSRKVGTDLEILPGFELYLKRVFNEREENNIYDIIAKHSPNDREAFDCFYEMMYAFLEEQRETYKPIRKIINEV